ncbi:MAG: hypothetical protein UV61_C0009G0039 [Candidatus Gottesmanbacteria bacterium GW2011_GWB1_43_11]|uniref:Uncharacterized protein n=1 Tax=Candidatus Gottesmanbacteria bacterium GW2011_GWB1_43_11 TaxID=1618446 RepID=A0A0G1CLX7_9BACT|nr:MAG: hypothetical protein UV17_C0031G0010 [Candidatus Gottesmanbacteria bacterium GW2011_GWA1_42_26]KKS81393.1 MAG: hypothetical protein UV55_C0015G0039 [Candidatus Gottesmanbacteria bacterium GW2011_GWC1_43_10]KKS86512.1 MAG: hypothetical protein UV61_C0009G0039 [Candidatus Gottesmanbacteria bacterium GW2011_GWB1_43_11]OGG07469.1 MAG: hypothetical protein A2699_03080 [Candidatus Gottesmanbacteria bacterium RIFCSPHIGHO2_01_FULL_43_15]OGG26515.1 MAG: hypothetical protein A3A59_06175 [Candidat
MANTPQNQFQVSNLALLIGVLLLGGIVGYQLARTTQVGLTPDYLRDTAKMMSGNSSLLQEMGEMMENKGTKYRDSEMMEKGKMMQSSGSTMMERTNSMMGMMGNW